MTFPEILPLALERVISILRGERAAFYQELYQLVNVIDATARAQFLLVVFFELVKTARGMHAPPLRLQFLEQFVSILASQTFSATSSKHGGPGLAIRYVSIGIRTGLLAGRPLCNLTHWRALLLSHHFNVAKIGRQPFG